MMSCGAFVYLGDFVRRMELALAESSPDQRQRFPVKTEMKNVE